MLLGAASSPRPALKLAPRQDPALGQGSLKQPSPALVGGWGFESPSGFCGCPCFCLAAGCGGLNPVPVPPGLALTGTLRLLTPPLCTQLSPSPALLIQELPLPAPFIFDTTYEPLATIEELSAPVLYATIDGASIIKHDPTFYMKVPISCVEPSSQDATIPVKGWRQLTDSECEALLNCLNREMAVWDIAS
ncbi:hypothetical protein DSO57_1003713 [Entomophthora muscae]|uniref:Uncharacterized protein n=1 Tax=Entomophthora muscae TaxID=34485 RepID=A0ACC2SY37_9FUNG|nr:hypothetical protein DSO57_1003713 [Entomophthora muscae]